MTISSSSYPVLTLDRFQLTAETPEEEQEVLALFFPLMEEKMTALRQWNPDFPDDEWRRTAHYVKGAAANLGMEALAEAARTAELCAVPTRKEALRLFEAIEAELHRVRDFFAAR